MKAVTYVVAAAGVAGALLAGSASLRAQGALPPGPKVKVVMVTQPGPGLPQYTTVDVPMLKEAVPQKSGGRIEVELASWPERNLSGPEIIRLVRSGQVDIGAAPLATVSGDVPFLDIVDLAGLNPTIEQARKVAEAVLPEANKALERFNTRIIAMYPFPAQVLFCRQPVNSLEDVKGRKVRTHGGSLNDFISAVGGQPVGIGFPEVYGALERGVVDCAVTGTASGNGARWYEVSKSMYALPLGWAVAAYYVNTSWWNRLDPQVRAFLEQTMKEVEKAQWDLGARATEDGIACNTGNREGCKIGKLVESNPMTVARPTPADEQALRRHLAETVLPAFVKRCDAACGEQYNKLVAPITGVRFGG
ncbi:MAG: TRAP transporter substrate-binding protein [Pseudomonadota bacterium]|nr:TRAP transporter substrate-binding protein [Pseudomonadota bacterium]